MRSNKTHRAASPFVRLLLACSLASPLFAPAAQAAPAGTVIANTANFRFETGGETRTGTSNTVSLTVAERLDVIVTADLPSVTVSGTGAGEAVRFRVTNTGNGAEDYDIAAQTDGQGATVRAIAIDQDGDGRYDPARDPLLPQGPLQLDPGQGIALFVVVDGVASRADVSLTARSTTGTGTFGTAFDGRGQGGGDAVVGQTGASATARTVLTLDAAPAPSLHKSQTVTAPDGSTRAVVGAVITYSLEARFVAATAAVEIDDDIPAGTTFVPASLMLDEKPLSDAADGDSGHFDGGRVKVSLGDVAAPGIRTIRFQVKIQ